MKKILKVIFFITFAIYLYYLYTTLFMRPSFFYEGLTVWDYLKVNVNLIPFKTIIGYVQGIINNTMNIEYPIMNLGGNIIMFIPLVVYLLCLIKKFRSLKNVLVGAFVLILVVEMIQLLTRKGAFDIDDLILNMCGVAIGFVIWKSKAVQKIYLYVFGEDEIISTKE